MTPTQWCRTCPRMDFPLPGCPQREDLLAGNVTLLVGVEADRVQAAIDVIREYSHSRKQMIPTTTEMSYSYIPTMPVEVRVGGATIFVVDVEQFERL